MEHDETLYDKYSRQPVNIGRMNDPDGGAWATGLCGDTVEMYLVIDADVITDARFYTDGCGATHACGSLATELAKGRRVLDALAIAPRQVIDGLGNLPEDHLHCAILAVSALHKAIADYMLRSF